MTIKEERPYCENTFRVIGIHVAAVLSIEEHFELQIILVDHTPLLNPIHYASVNKKCYYNPLITVPDHYTPVLIHIGTEPRSKVRPTTYFRVLIKLSAILPTKLVNDVLEVVNSAISIIALYSRLVQLVDQILVIFKRVLLDLRFGTMMFNTVIQACEIRQQRLRQSQVDGGVIFCDHCESRIVWSRGGVAQSRTSSCEVLS
jgi:hypothetical protein